MHEDDIIKKIRSIVFGMEDGLVSIWGLVVGVSVGSNSSQAVILAGIAGAVSAALSMAAGEYLSSKSKREVQVAAINRIRKQVKRNKKAALKRLKNHYIDEGFTEKQAKTMISAMARSDKKIIQQLVESEGHVKQTLEQPQQNAYYMFFSFIIAALFPIAPFILQPIAQAQQTSLVVTAIALFLVGATKSQATEKSWFKSGAEMLVIGSLAGAAGYLVGNFFA
ncbi:MAG: VIT1/CCC1 transporter family protein [Candidatus Nanoarchaeia archaeon]